MRRFIIGVAIVGAAIGGSGCSLFKTEAHVSSDTSWSGSFDGRTVSGTGSQTISLGGGTGAKCASVQKQTKNASQSVRLHRAVLVGSGGVESLARDDAEDVESTPT